MKIEVQHNSRSMNYIEETFSKYTEVFEPIAKTMGRLIIHLYPIEDTIRDNGELSGFQDSYNCHIHIYNVRDMLVYKTKSFHDQIEVKVPCNVRVFKDLSTMLIIDDPCRLSYHQSLEVNKIN